MNEALERLEEEYRIHRGYVVDAKDEATKRYWRTYAAGILHAIRTIVRASLEPLPKAMEPPPYGDYRHSPPKGT